MKKSKKKHPVFIPDPRGVKVQKGYWFDTNGEEDKQKELEYKLRLKASQR